MRFALQVGGEKQDRAICMLPEGPERRRLEHTHTRYVSACISTCYTPASADATVLPASIADTLPAYAVFPQRWTYQEFKRV